MKVRSTFRMSNPIMCTQVFGIPLGAIVYLAGPMFVKPDFNFSIFHAATAQLRSLGYTVVNPAEWEPAWDKDQPFAWHYMTCLLGDFTDILARGVTHIVTLDNYELSVGARAELDVAYNNGIPFIHHTDVPGMDHHINNFEVVEGDTHYNH